MAERYGHPELFMGVKKQAFPAYDGRERLFNLRAGLSGKDDTRAVHAPGLATAGG